MINIKKKIKNLLPDRVIYLYSIIKILPRYIGSSIKLLKRKYPNISFYDDIATVDIIVNERKSLSRFGDGEFMWMLGIDANSFENYTDNLGKELLNTLRLENKNLLIGIPYGMVNTKKCNIYAKMYWKIIKCNLFSKLIPFINTQKTYSNARITRPYIDYRDREYSRECFENLKRIWQDRDIIIIEGEQTKLGVGNDLFDNSKSIKRIICPSQNAFNKYNEIKKEIIDNVKKEELILAALGPTATILAGDMCKIGYQIIDIGHIDIEYIWYLRKEILRKKIEGKYVNESGYFEYSNYYDDDSNYLESIITKVN